MEVSVSINEANTYSVSELDYIRETIESMNKFNQVEVLRIMNKHNEVTLNENKYGVHINLSELKNEIIKGGKISKEEFEKELINFIKTEDIIFTNINGLDIYKQYKDNNKCWYEHNHIEYGHVEGNKPVGHSMWKGLNWIKAYGFIFNNNVSIDYGNY